MKIVFYIIYAIVFTYCYYFLNRRLPNKWILGGYPIFFLASILPVKLIYNALLPDMGKELATQYIIIILYAVAMITLFNFAYGMVNLLVGTQASFQQSYGIPNKPLVKWFLDHVGTVKGAFQLFFYSGGMILYGVVLSHAKL